MNESVLFYHLGVYIFFWGGNIRSKDLLFMIRLLVSTLFAIPLLPFFSVGLGRKTRAIAPHSTIAMLALHRHCRCQLLTFGCCFLVGRSICECWHCHSHCEYSSHSYDILLHCSMHLSVSCATSYWYYDWFVFVYIECNIHQKLSPPEKKTHPIGCVFFSLRFTV